MNGPSLICAPACIPHPLGKYYLYFADHHGLYIRLACANSLAGPWTVVKDGVLRLEQTPCKQHIASPNVHIDATRRELRMYFHGPAKNGRDQLTFSAHSADGLHFTARSQALGPAYFSVFQHGAWYYTITKWRGAGYAYRSYDGLTPFEIGPQLIPGMRHSSALVDGDVLWLFYTRIGDAPEQIYATRIDLTARWTEWTKTMSEPQLVLKPEEDWEGAKLPLTPSRSGKAHGQVNQLRDPAVYREGEKSYLVYSYAGESGLAIAELLFER